MSLKDAFRPKEGNVRGGWKWGHVVGVGVCDVQRVAQSEPGSTWVDHVRRGMTKEDQ